MQVRRALVATAAAALMIPMVASAAVAAPPTNDTPAGATVVTLPQTITEDTTEATTDALDAQLNGQCGAPATNASVWFTYTDATGDGLVVDVSASDYSAGAMIIAGDPANGGGVVACGPGITATRGAPGTTYYVMAFADTPGATGGSLTASFSTPPPAPTGTLTIDPRATAYKDGSLRLTGTYSCTNADGYSSEIDGSVVQRIGRTKVTGYLFVYPLECDGAVHTWDALVTSDTGLYAGGKAATVTVEFACGLIDCTVVEAQQTVQVTRGR